MALPPDLTQQIQTLLESLPLKQRQDWQERLSARYKGTDSKALGSKEEALLYLATRLPATYHVMGHVFDLLKNVYPQWDKLETLQDVGCGPGSSRWVVAETFPQVTALTLLEKNASMLEMARALNHPLGRLEAKNYVSEGLAPHDLSLASYTLSELKEKDLLKAVRGLLENTQRILVLIEPGTPKGFETLRRAREVIIQESAFILAPCGHERPCPMTGGDWCHFSKRLPRTRFHQESKGGTLGFEDEKFSYLIASKGTPEKTRAPRLIKKPQAGKGHRRLTLCTKEGIQTRTITKSKDVNYKFLARLEWGDSV